MTLIPCSLSSFEKEAFSGQLAVPLKGGWMSAVGEAVGDAHRPISHEHRAGLCPAHPTRLSALPCTAAGPAPMC